MNFTLELERSNDVYFSFEDGEYFPIDLCEDEPPCIRGSICVDDEEIGRLNLYELYNGCGLLDMCDAVSGDCETIAAVICDDDGKILDKYLPDEYLYETVLILDHISLDAQYRGKGIGSDIVKNLIHIVRYQFDTGSTIFLCASDYEAATKYGFDSPEYEKGCERLISFYEQAGFTVIKNNIMMYKE